MHAHVIDAPPLPAVLQTLEALAECLLCHFPPLTRIHSLLPPVESVPLSAAKPWSISYILTPASFQWCISLQSVSLLFTDRFVSGPCALALDDQLQVRSD
jgi:hypothetical protein